MNMVDEQSINTQDNWQYFPAQDQPRSTQKEGKRNRAIALPFVWGKLKLY